MMMKKLCLALFLMSQAAFADNLPGSSSPSATPFLKSPSTDKDKEKDKKRKAPPPKLIIPPEKKVVPAGEYFNHPGVVTSKSGQWIGGDNFTNIAHSVSLQVNIIKPENLQISFNREDLQSKIADIFSKSEITINTTATEYTPPLPFFNMMILAYPIVDGMVVAVQGRLFESVELKRVVLENNTLFQGITWEQTNLVVAPDEEIEKYIKNAVEEIAKSFATRVASAPVPENKKSTE
jgi:hypothetical protein